MRIIASRSPPMKLRPRPDADAIKIANEYLDDRDLALWQGPRLVTTLKSKTQRKM
jgi:hypothetical protein